MGKRGEYFRQLYIDVKDGKMPSNSDLRLNQIMMLLKISETESKTTETKTTESKTTESKINFKVKCKSESTKYNNYNDSQLEIIPFDKFTNIKVLEEGVCGLKVCCLKVEYNGKIWILKEMRPSFNNGKDYMLVDELKTHFGIKPINMQRIKSNKGLTRIDTTKRTLVKNWKWEPREVIYCMMENFDNIGDLGKHKDVLEDDNVFYECIKIRLYDGLFCSSDNILRNILVNSENILLSIDEGDIYGKRKKYLIKMMGSKGNNKSQLRKLFQKL